MSVQIQNPLNFFKKFNSFKKYLFIAITLISFSSWSNSLFVIEPGVGYKESNLKLRDLEATKTEYKNKAPFYFLSLNGYSPQGLLLTLRGEYAEGSSEVDQSTTSDVKFKEQSLSLQLGIRAQNLLKIYLGYSPYQSIAFTSYNEDYLTLDGQKYEAGLMFFIFSRVGLGLQYNIIEFNKIKGPSFTEGPLDKYFLENDSKELQVYLSLLF